MDFVTPAFSSLPGLEGTQGQSAKSPQAAEGMEVTTVIATFTMHCGGGGACRGSLQASCAATVGWGDLSIMLLPPTS